MAKYTVQSPSGKKVTFQWDGAEPPTDTDMDEIFGEADGPAPANDFADVEAAGSSTAPQKFPAPPVPSWAPSIGPGKKLAPEPSTTPESLDRILEAIGLRTPDPDRPGLSRTLAEEPLNESDFAATGRGLANTAATAAAPLAMGAAAVASPWALARAGVGGLAGATGGKTAGRSLGEQFDIPEIGAALGEFGGGYGGAKLGIASGPMATAAKAKLASAAQGGVNAAGGIQNPMLKNALDIGGAMTLDFLPGGNTGWTVAKKILGVQTRPVGQGLSAAAKEAAAIAETERMTRLHTVNSGAQPGPAFPPPPGMGASGLPEPPVIRPGAPVTGSGLTPGPAASAPPGFGTGGPAPLPQRAPGAPTSGSGLSPGPAAEAPTGMGAAGSTPIRRPAAPSSSTGFQVNPTSTPNVTLKVGAPSDKPAPMSPPPRPKAADVEDSIKAATTPQERGAAMKAARAGGATPAEIGKKLSKAHAGSLPLDPEDLATAKEILKQAGSLEEASKVIDAIDATPAQRRSLLRALKEAADDAK